jgi:hypothetical protein
LILIVEPEKKFAFILIEAKYVGPTEEGIRTSNSDEKTLKTTKQTAYSVIYSSQRHYVNLKKQGIPSHLKEHAYLRQELP